MISIEEIRFPVFRIRAHTKITDENRILTIESGYGVWNIDNKNLEGSSLGERRLRMRGTPYPLKDPAYTIEEFLKRDLSCKYIDNNGKIFKYKKTKFYNIETVPCNIEKLGNHKYKVTLPGKTLIYYSFLDISDFKYCVVINVHGGYLIYTFSDEMLPPTRRKL